MSTPRHVVVVGGGVIGTACAYYLSKTGWRVTILDQGRFGQGCSHGNCGLVCPSHVLPLAEPGAIGFALRSLCRRNSPFYIKPRFNLQLWSWLLRFARRCNTADMLAAGRACQALLESSIALYRRLLEEESLDCEWQERGLLFVYQSRAQFERYAATDQLLTDQYHLPAERIEGVQLKEFEPALKPGLAGGYYYRDDAHLRPDRLMSAWRRVLEHRGVTVHEDCEFKRFIEHAGKAVAAVTSRGEFSAEAFVVATGAWTPMLASEVGCRVPIQPGKGYSITMPRPAHCPAVPLILVEHRVAVTPMRSGYRLGSTMEFAGYDTSLNAQRLALLRTGAAHYLQEPSCEPVEEEWYGWRPMTFDGVPIIDRSPRLANVLLAAGHNMLGLSMAPATGRLVTELLHDEQPHVRPEPYSVRRF